MLAVPETSVAERLLCRWRAKEGQGEGQLSGQKDKFLAPAAEFRVVEGTETVALSAWTRVQGKKKSHPRGKIKKKRREMRRRRSAGYLLGGKKK